MLELNSLDQCPSCFPSQFPEMAIIIMLVGIHRDFLCFYMKSNDYRKNSTISWQCCFFFLLQMALLLHGALKFASHSALETSQC